MKQDLWLLRIEDSIDHWKQDGRMYVIHHRPGANYPWCLDWHSLTEMAGGGAPFKTYEDLDDYMTSNGIRRPMEQLTLGI